MTEMMWFDYRKATDAPAWLDEDQRIAWAEGWNAAVQKCTDEQNALYVREMGTSQNDFDQDDEVRGCEEYR